MNTHKSTYIATRPDMEGVQLAGFYSSIVDLITAGNRGKAFTWAINGADLSTDPAALQAAYDENSQAINDYLQFVDIDKIIRQITGKGDTQKYSTDWFLTRIPPLLLGAAIGAGIIAILK